MLDRWYRRWRLPMPPEHFHQLPQNPAFRYEYIDGEAWLTPRPTTYNAVLDLRPREAAHHLHLPGCTIHFRPLAEADWQQLPALFAQSFQRVLPFAALTDDDRLTASRECLEQTRTGGDGLFIPFASFVAEADQIIGAILITLIPKRDEGDWWHVDWDEAPTTAEAKRLLGRPHLTWVFVSPLLARQGIASALLALSVNELLAHGFSDLGTTFLLGNDSSALWHWKQGFRLLSYPGSRHA
jgi:GNAT superfamily N-acetyltransferase